MERKKRSKCSGWECCYAKKNSGRLESKSERAGRNLSNFAHTLTDTHTTGAKLVVRIVFTAFCWKGTNSKRIGCMSIPRRLRVYKISMYNLTSSYLGYQPSLVFQTYDKSRTLRCMWVPVFRCQLTNRACSQSMVMCGLVVFI